MAAAGGVPALDARHPALVLGVEHPRGLAVLRSLAAAGVAVDVVDRYRYAPGLHSRLPRRAHLLDTDDHHATLQFLESLEGLDQAVLIPTNDHYLGLVATHYDRLAPRFTMTVPRAEVLEAVLDKAQLFRFAASVGIATPVFHAPRSLQETNAAIDALDFGAHGYVFCLPPTSAEPADPETIRFTVPAGENRESARARASELFARSGIPPMIQEVVPGSAQHCVGVMMLVGRDHEPLGWRVVRRVKLFPYFSVRGFRYGGNVHCESAHDDEAVAAAATIVRGAKLFGVVTIEFRRRPADGRLLLMKIDPRVVGMAELCTALDFDVATLLYRLETGQPVVPPSRDYPDGRAWLWEKPYVLGLLGSRGRAWGEIPGAWRAFRRATTYAVWDPADPWPFMWNAAGGVRSQVRKRFLRERAHGRPLERWQPSRVSPS
jgi:predicted ATP-grasp superfamily ATP-dependent carboligase